MYLLYMFLYNIILYVIQPIIWIRLLWHSRFISEYRYNWLERYGFYYNKKYQSNSIVLHAVSVGETLSIVPLISRLQKNFPNTIITLTSMTPSGLKIARKLSVTYTNVQCMYLPYDLPGSINRFINYILPKAVVILETELWPNLINQLYQHQIPVILANARLSNISFKKYKKINRFFSHIMQRVTIVAAQNEEDAIRFLKLGLKKNQLCVTGNLKFDISINRSDLEQIFLLKKNYIKDRLTWIAGSTHLGEEIILLEVHKQLLVNFPNLLLILAPRHPERFYDVINFTKNVGFSYVLKSIGTILTEDVQVLINDTIGELMLLYGTADIAFIGGSLVQHGGHNPLEPAIYSIPLIMGPYIFNFSNICDKMLESDGLISVNDVQSLVRVMSMLLSNRDLRLYHGDCAFQIFKKNRGASYKIMNILSNYLIHDS